MALQLLPEEAQTKQLVLTAVKKDGLALAYAGAEWRRDAEVLRVALKQSEWAYDYVASEERQQAPVALKALEQGRPLPKQLLSNKEVGKQELLARLGRCWFKRHRWCKDARLGRVR